MNEALANEIFGKGRKANAPGAGVPNIRKNTTSAPSLASRMGVTKVRDSPARIYGAVQ
jgi:hypothetical protein